MKREWSGYRMVKKLWRYVKPFLSDTGTLRTDRWTDLLYQYRASVCWREIKIIRFWWNFVHNSRFWTRWTSRVKKWKSCIGQTPSSTERISCCYLLNPLIATLKPQQRTIIQQYSDWYTGHWWVCCYVWYSEEETGWGHSPPRPLYAVPNVTAHPSTVSVPTS